MKEGQAPYLASPMATPMTALPATTMEIWLAKASRRQDRLERGLISCPCVCPPEQEGSDQPTGESGAQVLGEWPGQETPQERTQTRHTHCRGQGGR